VQLNSGFDAKNAEMRNSMDLMLATIQSLSATLNDLKKDNAEMKNLLAEVEFGGAPGSSGSNEQLKAKNALIESLKKENQDLKLQRAEAAKQMNEIHQQVTNLKATRAPLKSVSGNEQQPKSLTLSLKFDDVNDQLIVSDLN
jgi:DNA repair exonuclease SbcCD ATPase subunit